MSYFRIVSVRTVYGLDYTRGNLVVDGENWGYTLEDVVRPVGSRKVKGKTAIPAGLYEVLMYDSPKFKKSLPWLQKVPDFNYILAHGGNKVMDTDGCILVASKYKAMDWIFQSLSDKLAQAVSNAIKAGRQVSWEVVDTYR